MALISDYAPNKKAHPGHEFQAQQNYSSLQTRESSNSDPGHEFWAQQTYSSLQTRESSNLKFEPKMTQISGTAKLFVTSDQRILKFEPQNDTTFGYNNINRHVGPENPQKPTQKDMTLEKMHSLTLTKK